LARPEIIALTNGAFAENAYILADRAAGAAVLIDPGEGAELFLRRLASERLTLEAVWLTHAHLDHILGVSRVLQQQTVPLYLHPADRPLYDGLPDQGAAFGIPAPGPPPPDHDLADGQRLTLGGLAFEVRHAPGHTPGHVAFVGHGVAIVGDVLFAGSIGRTDLPGGDTATLLASIRERLLPLPDETIVYPGHGPQTTIGQERRTNPFITGALRLMGER
jgi:hydroxyacylglutathione hydrolase